MRLVDKDWVELHKVTAAGSMSEYGRGWNEALSYVVESAPTIEAEPVRHGYWIKQVPNRLGLSNYFVCSQCAMVTRTMYKDIACDDAYCKHCGAKMDGKEEESDA